MIKTLQASKRGEREKLSVPRSVQRSIPIRRIYPGGMWQVGGGRYSMTFRFDDINYYAASRDDKLTTYLEWSALLNSLPTDATAKVTICNRKLNPVDFEHSVLLREQGDGLDHYRREVNQIIQGKTEAQSNIVRDKLITVSSLAKSKPEAVSFFSRVDTELSGHFKRLSSACHPLGNHDRLQVLHDFFRAGEETQYHFDMAQSIRRGHDFRDFICPDSIQFKADHFIMGDKVGRVLYLKDYASYIKDTLVSEICDFNRNMFFSIDILPIQTDEAMSEIEKKMLALETDAARWQRKQNLNNNFSSVLPYEMEQMRREIKEFYEDLNNDKRMMFVVISLVHIADNLEQLDDDTESLMTVARKHLCQFATLRHRQEDGLNTVLPYGMRKIHALRTLTTESVGIFIPFFSKEIVQEGGIYRGENAISRNVIVGNRVSLLNGNGIFCATSGGGKSMLAKFEILCNILASGDDVLVLDPEREYGPLVEALGGVQFRMQAGGAHRLNAMDMSRHHKSDENPLAMKAEFILSLCEQVVGVGNLGAKDRSIIDRCVSQVYRTYLRSDTAQPPTLRDFHAELLKQDEEEAAGIALAMELFISGSLDVFAHPSNVSLDNRLVSFDILELGEQLKPVGMLVVLDAIQQRIAYNRSIGKRTHVFVDELYLFFRAEYSAIYLSNYWRRCRKYNAQMTGILQDVEEMLRHPAGRAMLSNSEFLVMLNQSPTNRAELASLLNLTDNDVQLSYITNAPPGHGLLKFGDSIIPFRNVIPNDTEIYKLLSTKPGEG